MAKTNLLLDHPDLTAAELDSLVDYDEGPVPAGVQLASLIRSMASGVRSGTITVQPGAVAATGTVTFTDGAAEDAVVLTIAGQALTAKDSPANEDQFAAQGTAGDAADDAAAQATALAAVINAHSDLSRLMTATAAAGVVTLTALVPGPVGNFLTLVETTDTNTVSAVSGATLSGGTCDAPQTMDLNG